MARVDTAPAAVQFDRAADSSLCYQFLLTGFKQEEKEDYRSKILALGGCFHDVRTFIKSCTHVICAQPTRSEKFVCGCASGKWILKPDFISVSAARGQWQEESKFEWCRGDSSIPGINPCYIDAPRRWRERVTATGQGAFHGWKVLLHCNKSDIAVYQRVVEAGGGWCIARDMPIASHDAVVSQLTHVIVDKRYGFIRQLESRGIPCLLVECLSEHLFSAEPCLDRYRLPDARIMRLKTVQRTQDSADTDSWRSNPSVDKTRSADSRAALKRKLHVISDQPGDARHVAPKRRKLSHHHLPSTLCRVQTQCAGGECPARPFHSNLVHLVEAKLEDALWLDALVCISSSISSKFYPPPEVLHCLMKQVLQSPSLLLCKIAARTLKQVLCLHSPASHASLRKLYLNSLAPPGNVNGVRYHNEHWRFLDSILRRAMERQPQNIDDSSCDVVMETTEMLFQFLVAAIEEDLMATLRSAGDVTSCILAQVLWPSGPASASRKTSENTQDLMHHFVNAIKMAAKGDDSAALPSLISSLVKGAAEVSSRLGENRSPGNQGKGREEARKEFAIKLTFIARQSDILTTRDSLEMFLSMLRPSWLRQGVAECLLQNCDDQLLGEDRSFWARQPLTMKKIVSYYFYMVPPVASSAKKEEAEESKSVPLKTISNQQKQDTDPSRLARKKIGNVNRRNFKGETPLHQACIKNDIARVQDLLTSPFLNINARDNAGWTPLHEACNHGNVDCVQELLRFLPGRQLMIENKRQPLDLLACPPCGTTALHDAVMNRHVDVVKMLVDAGGKSLVTVKNARGLTPADYSTSDAMRNALWGQEKLLREKENEPKPTSAPTCFAPEIKCVQPHPSRYRQLSSTHGSGGGSLVTKEDCERFTIIVMALLQSYVRSRELHRVKAEVELVEEQQRLVEALEHRGVRGAAVSFSETTPFVSLTASPSLSKAHLSPPSTWDRHPVYTESSQTITGLLEDMEVFVDLDRHAEGLKVHLRMLRATADTKATACTQVSRSMRLIGHLCAIVC